MNIIYDNPWVRSFVAANPTYQLGARAPKGSWFFIPISCSNRFLCQAAELNIDRATQFPVFCSSNENQIQRWCLERISFQTNRQRSVSDLEI